MTVKGTSTALITPFTKDGIDFDALENLIGFQIENGIKSVVLLGTTGEPATLSIEEKIAIVKFVKEKANGKLQLIVGTGSNSTSDAIRNSKIFEDLGADVLLIVTPYYNKCTQSGLIKHYTAIANSVSTPIICYNVPSRTGVNMLPQTFATLAKHKNIVGIKESCGNLEQIEEVIRLAGKDADVISGDDSLTVPIISMGGTDVISVVSNVFPAYISKMTNIALDGDFKTASKMQLDILPLVKMMFSEVNPIPVKKASEIMGLTNGLLRLPLTEMSEENALKLQTLMSQFT